MASNFGRYGLLMGSAIGHRAKGSPITCALAAMSPSRTLGNTRRSASSKDVNFGVAFDIGNYRNRPIIFPFHIFLRCLPLNLVHVFADGVLYRGTQLIKQVILLLCGISVIKN